MTFTHPKTNNLSTCTSRAARFTSWTASMRVSFPPRRPGVRALTLGLLLGLSAAAGAQAAAPPVSVKPVDAARLKQEIAKRRGKVVLLNLWATWCPPCMAAYPDLVKLGRKYKPQGLEVISVTVDDPGVLKKSVLPFLNRQRPGFPTFIMVTKDQEGFIRAIDPKWQGDLPADVIYGPDGKRVATLTGEVSIPKLERLIKAQLARRPAARKRAAR